MISKNSLLAIKRIQSLARIHIDSFNFSTNQGFFFINFYLNSFLKTGKKEKNTFQFSIFGFHISSPNLYLNQKKIKKIPRQCRELKIDYDADFLIGVSSFFGSNMKRGFIFKIGEIPVMIKSSRCYLSYQNHIQLIEIDEEEIEIGGYFILKGLEKMIRLIITPKKNTLYSVSRPSNAHRGDFCTTLSCSIRSVDRIYTSRTFHLHYLTTGSIHARIVVNRKEFFIPVMILIKVLNEISDRKIFQSIIKNNHEDRFLRHRIMAMLTDSYHRCNLKSRNKTREFLGKILKDSIPETVLNDLEATEYFLSKYIFIHLGENQKSKIDLLFFMIIKLLHTQKGVCLEDNPDSIDSQEFLLPGHLILLYFKEKIENAIGHILLFSDQKTKKLLRIHTSTNKNKKNIYEKIFNKIFCRLPQGLYQLISTGSLLISHNQELAQTSGLSVSIDRINFGRFLSYFRSIHRGKFFLELKNTIGRKLYPQTWGFFCPVHTPDGLLCGILNHISSSVVGSLSNPLESQRFIKYLIRHVSSVFFFESKSSRLNIILDGKLVGFILPFLAKSLIDKFRNEKLSNVGIIPHSCEVLLISRLHTKSFFPSFIFYSEEARFIRPIAWKKGGEGKFFSVKKKKYFRFEKVFSEIELIGTMEQNFLNIRNLDYQIEFAYKNFNKSHFELEASIIFSVIASATPFCDMNQSPRNIYQCQMSKQSIGIPFYTFWRRNDSKSYFLITPQIPICRNKTVHDGLCFDNYPNGFNSIVTVLTYTGFDMEDAMVINKSSIERGFSMINIFNSFDLETKIYRKKKFVETSYHEDFLKVGNLLEEGDPLFPSKIMKSTKKQTEIFFCYKGSEKTVVDQVKDLPKNKKNDFLQRKLIKIRSRRRPSIGDKFASRHGQKGVFSFSYSSENLPFSDLGLNPEIIFNPHGFPSRMTMGVILESIVGKSGALNGIFHDSTPFRYGQNRSSIYHFGEKLRRNGFQFFGNELLYSGYTGEPFMMDTFVGIVNYQRLRHMVLDKFQVSNHGPRNSLTRQPIKGRKSGGSIRFGEMERDSVLGQGCAFLLHDRLHTSSDLHSSKIAIKTGNLSKIRTNLNNNGKISERFNRQLDYQKKILIPYVIKFLISELSSLNIKTAIIIK